MTQRKSTKANKGKPWVSAEGIRILRKAQKKILAEPKSYRQDRWHCGTAACIAAHVAMVAGAVPVEMEICFGPKVIVPMARDGRLFYSEKQWGFLAQEALGSDSTANLFSGYPSEDWPSPFRDDWRKDRTRKARAEVAVRRIDHFIKTGA